MSYWDGGYDYGLDDGSGTTYDPGFDTGDPAGGIDPLGTLPDGGIDPCTGDPGDSCDGVAGVGPVWGYTGDPAIDDYCLEFPEECTSYSRDDGTEVMLPKSTSKTPAGYTPDPGKIPAKTGGGGGGSTGGGGGGSKSGGGGGTQAKPATGGGSQSSMLGGMSATMILVVALVFFLAVSKRG